MKMAMTATCLEISDVEKQLEALGNDPEKNRVAIAKLERRRVRLTGSIGSQTDRVLGCCERR